MNRNYSLAVLVIALAVFCYAPCESTAANAGRDHGEIAIIQTDHSQPTLDYAADELCRFLKQNTNLEVLKKEPAKPGKHWLFHLVVDPAVEPTTFSIIGGRPSNGQVTVMLMGSDAAAVLHAVYSTLERMGICFDITGPILPEKLDLKRLIGWSCRVQPDVKLRGIRQYLNFPMDISSYPLSEAKEYVRNVARLRFNLISFHTYSGIFYACPELKALAGGFFYGQRHDVPDLPLFHHTIRNQRIFCIPEIEAVDDRLEERSRAAIYWLAELMDQAKTCGLTVQFSFEPPGANIEEGEAACRAILASYPSIQILELITAENNGHPEQTLKRYLDIAKQLRAHVGPKCPHLAVGVYETGGALKEGLAFLRQNCPSDISWTFLPAHGARASVDAIRKAGFTADDWKRSTVHTWAEFDGLMYLQQNSLVGTRQLLDLARAAQHSAANVELGAPTTLPAKAARERADRSAGAPIIHRDNEQVPAIDFIHWRTAENRTAIRYAALACLNAQLTPEAFYRDYAKALGVGAPAAYAKAMSELDNLDAFCRDHLFNIGFCYVGCWINPKGLGWTRGWKKGDLQSTQQRFTAIEQALDHCLKKTSTLPGRQYLRFLQNRIRCTVIHLEAVGHLLDLHALCNDNHPELLDEASRTQVALHCRLALEQAERYMQLHAQAIADRGGEGTLISYYHTIPAYVNHIREIFLKNTRTDGKSLDGPPGPPAPRDNINQ